MQKHNVLIQDIRSCMTRCDPLTPEIVAVETKDGLTSLELKEVLSEYGMNIKKAVQTDSASDASECRLLCCALYLLDSREACA